MGLGLFEIVILAAIALVVMGPEKFPDFAKIVIRTVRDVRGYMNEVTTEVSKELRPVQKELNQISRYDANPSYHAPGSTAAKKPSPTPTPSKAPEAQVDAQNTVDPAVTDEATPFSGPKEFEEATATAKKEGSNGTPEKAAPQNYHADADQYPD